MEEPGWGWPAWKFGMKRDDLFGSLNDQYNTFSSTILDPEAFHHDVFEISNEATSSDDFHRRMACRKQQRLRELNESLESAAVEIIANPKLIGTDKWQYALQLFRTRSLDSLIRYFASYLPDDYMSSSSTYSSFDDSTSVKTTSTKATSVEDSCPSFFGDHDDAVLTHEPLSIKTDMHAVDKAASADDNCPSLFEDHTDTSASSPTNLDSMSFSGSDSEHFVRISTRRFHDDESQAGEVDSPIASVSDLLESQPSFSTVEKTRPVQHVPTTIIEQGAADGDGGAGDAREDEIPTYDSIDDDDIPPAQRPTDDFDFMESETPTPRQEPFSPKSYLDHNNISPRDIPSFRSASPKQRFRRREGSPLQGIRRSPEESLSRIQKPMPEPIRDPVRGTRPAMTRKKAQ